MVTLPQAGRSVALTHGPAGALTRLVVAQVGGGIRELTVGDRTIIDGYGAIDRASAGRGQILAPWPNRLRDGAYEFDGHVHQAPISDVPGHNAIHGLVRWLSWDVDPGGRARVSLPPQPGWPTWLSLAASYRLEEGGLIVDLVAVNDGDQPCPFGLGMHPYLTAPSGRVDDLTLTVPAGGALQTDGRGLPVRWLPLEGSVQDFRAPRRIGAARLDTCYRTGPGGFEVKVDDLTVWAGAGFDFVQVFTGDTDPDPSRRRTALAVEPMTCPPDAFNTGEGLRRLEPGERWEAQWGLRWPSPPGGAGDGE